MKIRGKPFEIGCIPWNKGVKSGNHGNGFQNGMIPWNKGKKGLQVAWNKDKFTTEEVKIKISEAHKGKKHSLETIVKMRQSHKGIGFTSEWSRRKSEAQTGSRNHQWKGGISPESNLRIGKAVWKKLAKQIRERDNYTCLYCKTSPANDVHHMLPVRLDGSDNEDNLLTLCDRCHKFIEQKIK